MFLTGTRKQRLTGVERRPRRQESAIMLWQQSSLGDTQTRFKAKENHRAKHDSEKTVEAVRMAPMGMHSQATTQPHKHTAGLERMKDHRVTTNLESVLFN